MTDEERRAWRREYNRKWRAENPGYAKAWRDANPERCREKSKRSYYKNPEAARERAKRWAAANPERRRENWANFYANNKQRLSEKKKALHAANPEKRREERQTWLAKDPERTKQMYEEHNLRKNCFTRQLKADAIVLQQNRCAICQVDFSSLKRRHIHADHCHKDGSPRGVLCHWCNIAIGSLRDDPELLRAAIAYLENPPLKNGDDCD